MSPFHPAIELIPRRRVVRGRLQCGAGTRDDLLSRAEGHDARTSGDGGVPAGDGHADAGGLDGDEILAGPFEGNLAIGCVDARLSEALARVGGHPEPATLTANELGPQEVDDRVMVKVKMQALRGTAVHSDFQATAPGDRAIPFEDGLVDHRHEATCASDDGGFSFSA